MDVSKARRLKTLEEENARLKRLLADAMIDNVDLNDLLGKTCPPQGTALRNPTSYAPSPAATPALRGKSNRPNELQSG